MSKRRNTASRSLKASALPSAMSAKKAPAAAARRVPPTKGARELRAGAATLPPATAGSVSTAALPIGYSPNLHRESAEGTISFPFPRVTITRGNDIAFEIELCLGDITETPTRVILLGQFQGMDPSSPVLNLDSAMNGALLKLIGLRRAVYGSGELDIIPIGRHPVFADMIAFLGLGHWNVFNGDVLASSTHSALRSLLASHFDEFATVLMGGRIPSRPEFNVSFSLRYMIRGFIQALRDDPDRDRFRRIVIVESDPVRMREIQKFLRVLVQEDEFEGVRTTLCASELPPRRRENAEATRSAMARHESSLLMLAMQPDEDNAGTFDLEAILHTRDGGAAIVKKTSSFPNSTLDQVYRAAGVTTQTGLNDEKALKKLSVLVTSILPQGVLSPLKAEKDPRIELIHDADSSRLPWETLALADGSYPALLGGFSRRFVSERAAVIWSPKPAERLRILMVIDPLGDLPGARREGAQLRKQLADNELTTITLLERETATKQNLSALLAKQPFDILHYAGHSGFNRENARFSGLLLHHEKYFTGADVLALAQFPPVVVFNSCEAARIRRRDPVLPSEMKGKGSMPEAFIDKIRTRDAAHGALSIAEAFLIAGVQHYVGTFWPVDDAAATTFGAVLYNVISAKGTMGKAVTEARKELRRNNHPDWANYIHYGNPDAVVFAGKPNG